MSGPLSTNAPFTGFGQTMILRDIEQLYLLIGNQNGDMGNAGYSTKKDGDLGKNAAATAATSIAAASSSQPVAVVYMSCPSITYPTILGTATISSTKLDTIGISTSSTVITLPSGVYSFQASVALTVFSGAASYRTLSLYNGATSIFQSAGAGGYGSMPIIEYATNLFGTTYSIVYDVTGTGGGSSLGASLFNLIITKLG